MPEFIEAANSDRIIEVFGCGTACMVAPIHSILYEGQVCTYSLQFPSSMKATFAQSSHVVCRTTVPAKVTLWSPPIPCHKDNCDMYIYYIVRLLEVHFSDRTMLFCYYYQLLCPGHRCSYNDKWS